MTKITGAPLTGKPDPKQVLAAIIGVDGTVFAMQLSDFVSLIAADKATLTALEEIVAQKVDEQAFAAAQAALDKRLSEMSADIGEIDTGTAEGLAALKLNVANNAAKIAVCETNISKNEEAISKLEARVKALEGQEPANPAA